MLTLPYDHEARFEGHVVGKLGLAMTLWLDPQAKRNDAWRGLLRAAEVFATLAGPHLAWWSSTLRHETSWLSTMAINSSDEDLSQDSAEELRKVLNDASQVPFSALALDLEPTALEPVLLELALGGETPAGQQPWSDVLDWMFYANLPVEQAEVAGFIRVHIPTYATSGQRDASQCLREFMRACVQVMPVLHGTAGWAVQLPLNYRYFHANLYGAVALFDLVKSHAGVDVYDPAEMAISLTQNCYTANWLNYLGLVKPDQIDTAISVAQSSSHAGLIVEKIGHGLFVQAGASPALLFNWYSQENAASVPASQPHSAIDLYRAAAALMKPWRLTDPSNECIAPPRYGYADTPTWHAACAQYLRRFD